MITVTEPQTEISPLCERLAWKVLQQHHANINNEHLGQFFADNPHRGEFASRL
jgi:hypothetical protein